MKTVKTAEDMAKIAGTVVKEKINPPFNPEYVRLLIKDIRVLVNDRVENILKDGSSEQTLLEKIFLEHLKDQLGINACITSKSYEGTKLFLETVEEFLDRIEKQ